MISSRSQSSLTIENNKFRVEVHSRDLTSLRAALNSYLKWFLIIKDISQIIDSERIKEEE